MIKHLYTAVVLFALVISSGSHAEQSDSQKPASAKIIEILILDVKPGQRDEFHKIYERDSLPLLRKWKMDVMAHGPSIHDASSYYVIRAFNSLQDRQKAEDAFYDSDDWKNGPKSAILAMVDHFAYIVLPADAFKEVGRRL